MSRDHSDRRRAGTVIISASWLTAVMAALLSAQSAGEPPRDSGEGGFGLMTNEMAPFSLQLDVIPIPGASDGNGVFEPGERVLAVPTWRNLTEQDIVLSGIAAPPGLEGPPGATYSVMDGSASYGVIAPGGAASCLGTGDCSELQVSNPVTRPVFHWDAVFTEVASAGSSVKHAWTVHLGESFGDVPRSNKNYRFIETLLHQGVTGGCAPGLFCPSAAMTREQMAVFVLASKYGPGWAPQPCQAGSEMFDDVPASSPFCPWIEALVEEAAVEPCSATSFCPTAHVPRGEQAKVIVSAKEPPGFEPAACVPGMERFKDVPASHPQCAWIEAFATHLALGGDGPIDPTCSPDIYCPSDDTLRGDEAAFLVGGFDLRLYEE